MRFQTLTHLSFALLFPSVCGALLPRAPPRMFAEETLTKQGDVSFPGLSLAAPTHRQQKAREQRTMSAKGQETLGEYPCVFLGGIAWGDGGQDPDRPSEPTFLKPHPHTTTCSFPPATRSGASSLVCPHHAHLSPRRRGNAGEHRPVWGPRVAPLLISPGLPQRQDGHTPVLLPTTQPCDEGGASRASTPESHTGGRVASVLNRGTSSPR